MWGYGALENAAGVTKELNLKFYLVLFNLNVTFKSSHSIAQHRWTLDA